VEPTREINNQTSVETLHFDLSALPSLGQKAPQLPTEGNCGPPPPETGKIEFFRSLSSRLDLE
jgi:hypothetical protein